MQLWAFKGKFVGSIYSFIRIYWCSIVLSLIFVGFAYTFRGVLVDFAHYCFLCASWASFLAFCVIKAIYFVGIDYTVEQELDLIYTYYCNLCALTVGYKVWHGICFYITARRSIFALKLWTRSEIKWLYWIKLSSDKWALAFVLLSWVNQ